MATIDNQVEKQEEDKKKKVYEDNSTDAERLIYSKLKNIVIELFIFRI